MHFTCLGTGFINVIKKVVWKSFLRSFLQLIMCYDPFDLWCVLFKAHEIAVFLCEKHEINEDFILILWIIPSLFVPSEAVYVDSKNIIDYFRDVLLWNHQLCLRMIKMIK